MPYTKEANYLGLALDFAQRFSKDRSTKVGALFLHPTEYTQLASGYNGLPRKCNDELPERHERPLKYSYFEHAERNAIYNVVRAQLRSSLLLHVSQQPGLSMDDVRAAVSVGIKHIVFERMPPAAEFALQLALFQEAGVEVQELAQLAPNHKLHAFAASVRLKQQRLTKDPVGDAALFLHPQDYDELAFGYSGLPRGADDSCKALFEPPEREFWVESGIRNAIYNKARPILRGSTLVVGPLPPCAVCARGVAAVGTKLVVTVKPPAELVDRWGAHFARTRSIFERLGVELVELDAQDIPR